MCILHNRVFVVRVFICSFCTYINFQTFKTAFIIFFTLIIRNVLSLKYFANPGLSSSLSASTIYVIPSLRAHKSCKYFLISFLVNLVQKGSQRQNLSFRYPIGSQKQFLYLRYQLVGLIALF